VDDLRLEYERRHAGCLILMAHHLQEFIANHFVTLPRIDRISARAKSVDRFLKKASKTDQSGNPKYTDPLNQIQDQLGARIVTFYKHDVETVAARVEQFFRSVEKRVVVPDSPHEFGYEGQHFILFIPEDLLDDLSRAAGAPLFFELQVKTLFQHAWGEAEHDLGYKPATQLTRDQKRRVAFTSAQAWGADQMFQELFNELSA